jgi:pseudouridine-5'-phosphate glycosidase
VDYRADSPTEIAAALQAKREMGLSGGMVITNPIPAEHAMDKDEIDAVISDAIVDMKRLGVTGKDTTPFLLARIAERTEGRSLAANIELVVNNARLAAEIARAL